ncbi:MAG: DUF1959 family protein [Methanomicrobiales archaeon]
MEERFLYERDLTTMKYTILTSTRHDRAVRQLAERFGVRVQAMRRILIDRLDMSTLENLPVLLEAETESDDPVDRALGRTRFTRYIPLIPGEEMERIMETVRSRIGEGLDFETAVATGRDMAREVLTG